MSAPGRRLTLYFGESDRVGSASLERTVVDVFAAEGAEASVVLRGSEGFGAKHRLRSDRLLTLSDDLPLVAIAAGGAERIERCGQRILEIAGEGMLTLERVVPAGPGEGASGTGESRLTAYLGRRERLGGRPAHLALVDALHAAGVAGATVLLGVDGVIRGRRRRARFLSANADVPLIVVAIGSPGPLREAIASLGPEGEGLIATQERVRVCKRDGVRLAGPEPDPGPSERPEGLRQTPPGWAWRRLTLFCSEASEHRGRSLPLELIRRLRQERAAGATALRGVWGYHGGHLPHGDTFTALRRRVPTVITVVDTAERCRRWFGIFDELTEQTGLLISEPVPVVRQGDLRSAAAVSGGGGRRSGRPGA